MCLQKVLRALIPDVLKEGLSGIIARAKSEKENMFGITCQLIDASPAGYHKMVILNPSF